MTLFPVKLEATTLSGIGDGALEEKFQARLRQIVPVFADPRPYASDPTKGVKAKIIVEIELTQDPSGATVLAKINTDLKLPKEKAIICAITRRGPEFYSVREQKQEPLSFPRAAEAPKE